MSSEDIESQSQDSVEKFFDANEVFVDNEDKDEDKTVDKVNAEDIDDNRGLFGLKKAFNRLIGTEDNRKPRTEQIVISIKNETKREAEMLEQLSDQNIRQTKRDKTEDKSKKFQIIFDNETTEDNENIRTEVTVINEDDIQIDSDDIEMTSLDSIHFLVILSVIFILNLFLISGTAHWLYNSMDGIDWQLLSKTYFNFHIFFMTLGICGFSFGLLIHRIFRGWSTGALHFLHTFFTLTTLVFFVIGVYAVVVSLNHLNCIHLYSVHSWMGFISLVSFTLLLMSAFITFLFPRFDSETQRILIPVHSFFGRMIFTVVCGTAVTGIADSSKLSASDLKGLVSVKRNDSNGMSRETDMYWDLPEKDFLCNLIAIGLVLYTICVNHLASNDSFRRRLLPEEQGIDIKSRFK